MTTAASRFEKEIITRTRQIKDSNEKLVEEIEEVVESVKRIFPVRKQVKQRKKMEKFGEVANTKRGDMKNQRETIIENNIQIETLESAQKEEIDIINKIKNLTTEKMKKKKKEEELKNIKKGAKKTEKKDDVKAGDKLEEWSRMKMAESEENEKSIRIDNIVMVVDPENPSDLQYGEILSLLSTIDARPNLKVIRKKFNKDLGYAYLSYPHMPLKIYDAYSLLEQQSYNSCILEIKWAKPSNQSNQSRPPQRRNK